MPDEDVRTIGELIHYQYATIIAKNAFAASDGESGLKHWGDKKLYDSIPPLLHICRCRNCSGTADIGDLDADGETTVRDIDWVLGSGGGRFNGGS